MSDRARPWGSLLWRTAKPPSGAGSITVLVDVAEEEMTVPATMDALGYVTLRWPLHVPFPFRIHPNGCPWPDPGLLIPWHDGSVPHSCWLGELGDQVTMQPTASTNVRFHGVGSVALPPCQVVADTSPARVVEMAFDQSVTTVPLPAGWCTVRSNDPAWTVSPSRVFIPVASSTIDQALAFERTPTLRLRAGDGTAVDLVPGINSRLQNLGGATVQAVLLHDVLQVRVEEGLLGYEAAGGSDSKWGTSITIPPRVGSLTVRTVGQGKPRRTTFHVEPWEIPASRPPTAAELHHLIPAERLKTSGSNNLRWGEPFDGLLWADGLDGLVRIPGPPATTPGVWYVHLLAASEEARPLAVEMDGRPMSVIDLTPTGGFTRDHAGHAVSGPLWVDSRVEIVLRAKGFMPHLESVIWSQESRLTWSLESRDKVGVKERTSAF